MAGQGSVELGANRERSVKKCELDEGTRFSGRLCLPDSRGAGAGRMPPLLGLPSGRTKWPLTLKTLTLKTLTLKTLTLEARLQGKGRPPPGITQPLSGVPAAITSPDGHQAGIATCGRGIHAQ